MDVLRRMMLPAAWVMLALGSILPAAAQEAPAVTIPRSEVHDLVSRASGKAYRLMIWRPAAKPPAGGYPVVYLLDGNATFGTVTDIIDARSRRPGTAGMVPAVVVGLAYPTDEPYDIDRRTFDLTPPAPAYSVPPRPNGQPWPPMGGADAFLRFIEDEVKPFVAARAPVDASREILMGHSFGGLFALHVLLTHSQAFDAYAASSPSLWFNDGWVMKEADAVAASSAERSPADLFLSVGGLEQSLNAVEAAQPDADKRLAWKAANRMIGNARDLAVRLGGVSGLSVAFEEFPGEDHASVVPLHINRALGLLLKPRAGGVLPE